MRHFAICIIWRGYRWNLKGVARSSVGLLVGLLDHIPADAYVRVRAL